jgi:hypothetical protein
MLGQTCEFQGHGRLLLPFWKIPHTVTDDTGYFKTHAAAGGGFELLVSDSAGQVRSWANFSLL